MILLQYVGMITEKDVGEEEHVVEVHRITHFASVRIAHVQFSQHRHLLLSVRSHDVFVIDIYPRRYEVVLGG